MTTGRLYNKVALVVGAGSIGPGWGNGKATSVLFAREGARVFCTDVNGAAADETVRIIREEGGAATPFRADVSKSDDIEAMVAACMNAHGRIDVLNYNVGIAEVGGVVDVAEDDWDRVFAVNLKGAYLAMKHVIPIMQAQGGGSIVNISSIAAIRYTGIPYATYSATKAALNHLTKTAAVAVRAGQDPGQRRPARAPEDADGGEIRRLCAGICRRRRGKDVGGAQCPVSDGRDGRCLGRRLRRALPRLGRGQICHRPGTRRRRRHYAEMFVSRAAADRDVPCLAGREWDKRER